MNAYKALFTLATLSAASLITCSTNAQQWSNSYNQGSNYGHVDSLNWDIAQGTQYQNPRAAAIGGILGGIGQGLAGNPKNGTAASILSGMGAGLGNAAGRTDFSQGNITHTRQGYNNRWGNSNTSYDSNYGQHNGFSRPGGGPYLQTFALQQGRGQVQGVRPVVWNRGFGR